MNAAARYRLVGLDLSLAKTGFAALDGTTITVRPPARLEHYHRHAYITETVLRLVGALNPDVVIVEGYAPHMPGAIATIRSAEVGGIVRTELTRRRVDFLDVAPSTLKRWATGNGNASKAAMIGRAVELGARLTNDKADDEADAYLLKLLGEDLYNGAGVTAWPDALEVLNGPIPIGRQPR
jgi:crossover junction endodeoxyribonuclease RuvC